MQYESFRPGLVPVRVFTCCLFALFNSRGTEGVKALHVCFPASQTVTR